MSRVTRGLSRHKHLRRVLKAAKGYVGGRRRLYRIASETLMRARAYQFRDRRQRKRHFRSLWIIRINAAARENGITYSQLMKGLKKASIGIDRKHLADLAYRDAAAFNEIAAAAKSVLQ